MESHALATMHVWRQNVPTPRVLKFIWHLHCAQGVNSKLLRKVSAAEIMLYPCVAVLVMALCGSVPMLVQGFPSGAPAAACSTLAPNQNLHLAPPQDPEMVPVPYSLNLSSLVLSDGSGYGYKPGRRYMCECTAIKI